MIKHYKSGLQETSFYSNSKHRNEYPFYTAHYLSDYFSEDLENQEIVTQTLKQIKYSLPLIAQYYHTVGGVNYINRKDMRQKIRSRFESDLTNSIGWCYYEPLILNKKIALECDLVPFQFDGINLLSTGWLDGKIVWSKLEAYQLIVHNTIDEDSNFFVYPKDHFIRLREEAAGKVLKLISQQD